MKYGFVFLLLIGALFANVVDEIKTIKKVDAEIIAINAKLENPNNLWMKRYSNYQTYRQVSENLEQTQSEIEVLKKEPKTIKNYEKIGILERNLAALEQQRKLLDNYKDLSFQELTEIKDLEEAPRVTNPILILRAYSYINRVDGEITLLKRNFKTLSDNLEWLEQKDANLKIALQIYDESNKKLQEVCRANYCLFESKEEVFVSYQENLNALTTLQTISEVFKTTLEISIKDLEEKKTRVKAQIKAQIFKGIYIGVTILVLVGIALSLKLGVRKYIHDNERIYTTNKIINFLNITLIVVVLLFAYLDNVGYLVTVLGFASAGLAIAMKDLFMSVLGWIVIVVGGAVHAGDRIKVVKDGAVYVGDVLDISVLRITLYEDITLTTYTDNRRAGRIIFIPNNYIFTTMFSNYTHGGMKSVWDGIDFTITFDSNHAKACHIARECAKKYAKGYTDSTRKQFAKMRDRFTLRSTNVEPRVFSLLESNGVRISVWYLTNAYATLALRSSISAEIIDLILQESDITIAYPSTMVYEGKSNLQSEAYKSLQLKGGAVPPIST